MKKSNLFAAAMCAAVVFATPGIKQQLHAEDYCTPPETPELGEPVYTINSALIQETVKVPGCAAIPKRVTNGDVTFYNSGIAVIEHSPGLDLQADWAQVKTGIINVSLTPESEQALYDFYSEKGLAACQSKFPQATEAGSGVVSPSVLTTASQFKVNGKHVATGKVQMKGFYLNDGKRDKANQPTAANLQVKLTVKGNLQEPLP